MRSFLVAAIIVVLLVGCASRDTRLEGRWKSNKALTLATVDAYKPPSDRSRSRQRRATFDSLFGKLVVSYRRGTVTFELPSAKGSPPYRNTDRYRIVASDSDSLVVLFGGSSSEASEITHVYFDGPDRYWIHLHRTGMKEYFDRIAP